MATQALSEDDYRKKFGRKHSLEPNTVQVQALHHALDTRKFEIELYWKHARSFWAFIGAAFAGYIAIQALGSVNKQHPCILLACLGLVFSFAWYLASRGSRFRQENWDHHVDMLEDPITGPLHKVALSRPPPRGLAERVERILTGPAAYSVSSINQILSVFVTVVWGVLLFAALPRFSWRADIHWLYAGEVGAAALACGLLLFYGRRHAACDFYWAELRGVQID